MHFEMSNFQTMSEVFIKDAWFHYHLCGNDPDDRDDDCDEGNGD